MSNSAAITLPNTNIGVIGEVKSYAGFATPSGWLLCDGTAYSRTTYSALFAALSISTTGDTNSTTTIANIPSTTNMDVGMPVSGTNIPAGTTIASIVSGTSITISQAATGTTTGGALVVAPHGVGDGSTTFNVPDFRSSVLVGAGQGSGLTKRVLGTSGGEETHILSTTEMPAHNHTDSGHSHGASGSATAPSISHSWSNQPRAVGATNQAMSSGSGFWSVINASSSNSLSDVTISASAPSVSVSVGTGNATITNTGGGGAHNNMQPWKAVNYIIKY